MIDFEGWLDDMATQSLPGGVAAAATAAALGAALVAKTGRITLQRVPSGAPPSRALLATVEAAEKTRAELLDLAAADVRAYRGWLESRRRPAGDSLRQRAPARATEIPMRIVETCQALLDRSLPLVAACWPTVRTDLEIGRWLLETGVRAGSLAANENQKQEERDRGLAAV
jgi:formiminotetrahydrofolate cyclodeaminase